MGELEIKTGIKNEMLQGLATAIDTYNGNGNGKIDTKEEWSIFKATETTKEYKDDEQGYKAEFDEIMGLQKTSTQTATLETATRNLPAQQAQGPVITGAAVNSKEAQKAVKKNLEYWVKNGARPEEIMLVLRDRIKDSSYQIALNDVEMVLNLVNATKYNSKADVKAIESRVKKQLTNDFQKDILKVIIKQAEMEQTIKEKEALKQRYEEIKTAQNGKNYYEYAEQLKKELKTSKKWNESYTKEAFKLLEETDVKADASKLIDSDIQKAAGTKDKDVRKNTKANYTDKKVRKLVDKEYKDDSKVFARKNKVTAKKAQLANGLTQKQIEKEVGKDTFELLKRSYLADTPNNPHILPDGKYDLSELSDIVLKRFGANYYGDRNDGDKKMSEFENLKAELKDKLGVKEDLSDTDVKDIIKLCAFELQGRDRSAKHILDKALWGLPSAVAGAAGAAGAIMAFGKRDLINYYSSEVNVAVNVTTNVTVQMAQEACDKLKEIGIDASVNATANAVDHIDVNIPSKWEGSELIDHRKSDALKGAIGSLALSILTNALMAAIFGGDRNETSCMSVSDYDKNDETYTNPDKFKEHFANTTKDKQKISYMNALVDVYVDKFGDNWHVELQNEIRKAAGLGSKLNPEECRMFFKYNQPPVDAKKEEVKKDETKQTVEPEDDGTKKSVCRTEKIASYHNGDNYQWSDLARMYKCLDDYNPGKKYDKTMFKARFMKVLQGISDKNYDFIRIVELTKKSLDDTLAKRGQVSLKNEQGFDYDEFMKYMGKSVAVGDDNKDVIAPLELTVDGESNCSRDLTRLGTPTPYKKKGGKNNPQIKIKQGTKTVCEYTITDKNGTRKVTKEEYQKSKYRDVSGE